MCQAAKELRLYLNCICFAILPFLSILSGALSYINHNTSISTPSSYLSFYARFHHGSFNETRQPEHLDGAISLGRPVECQSLRASLYGSDQHHRA